MNLNIIKRVKSTYVCMYLNFLPRQIIMEELHDLKRKVRPLFLF